MAISEQNIYTNSVHIEVHQEHTYMDNYVGNEALDTLFWLK